MTGTFELCSDQIVVLKPLFPSMAPPTNPPPPPALPTPPLPPPSPIRPPPDQTDGWKEKEGKTKKENYKKGDFEGKGDKQTNSRKTEVFNMGYMKPYVQYIYPRVCRRR